MLSSACRRLLWVFAICVAVSAPGAIRAQGALSAQVEAIGEAGAQDVAHADSGGEDKGTPKPETKPNLVLIKYASEPELLPDGTCTVEFDFEVKNRGHEKIVDLQIFDAVADEIFPARVVAIDRISADILQVNTHFNGIDDITLLASEQSIEAGTTLEASFRLHLNPDADQRLYENKAISEGTGAESRRPFKYYARAKFECPAAPPEPIPQIGAAKLFRDLERLDSGEYAVTVRAVVENLSDEPLNDVQLQDNLAAAFAEADGVRIIDAPRLVEGVPLSVNPDFDGVLDLNLLGGAEVLPPGSRATLEFRVAVRVGSELGPYSNQIVAEARAVAGERVTDLSDDGTEPDPNGNGIADEPGENDPSLIEFPPFEPDVVIGIAKELIAIEDLGNDRFAAEFRLVVENLSAQAAPNVQVTDDLAAALAPVDELTVNGLSLSGDLSQSAGDYDGVTQTNLLSGAETLPGFGRAELTFAVEFVSSDRATRFNQALATSTSDAGSPLAQDLSDDGSEPDPNGNGVANDSGEDDPTPIELPGVEPEPPVVGLANELSGLVELSPGLYQAEYTLLVENLGSTAAPGLQIADDLAGTFAGLADFEVVSVELQGALSALNPDFDGRDDTALLTGAEALNVGSSAVITVRVTFSPGANFGPFVNQPVVTATLNDEVVARDLSDDGAVVDNDGDGNPDEAGENDPTVFELPPVSVGVAKALTSADTQADGSTVLTFAFAIENLSDTRSAQFVQLTDDLAQTFPGGVLEVLEPPTVSGALASGNQAFDGVNDVRLLGGTESLGAGESALVSFALRVTGVSGEFLNQAELTSALSEGGSPIARDLSDDGDTPDPNDNGNAGDPGEDDPTPVLIVASPPPPAIGLANELTGLVETQPGVFQAEFTLRVENLGDTPAPAIQIADDLATTFADLPPYEVISVSVSGDLDLLNPAFDGAAESNVLSGTETLPVGGSAVITVVVNLTPGENLGPFINQPVVTSRRDGQIVATDPSDDGAVVDSDGDGNANEDGENDPTVFSLPPVQIGVAKSLVATNTQPNGSTELTFEFLIENLSAMRSAHFVQLTDDLAATFPGATLEAVGVPEVSGGLSAGNTAYDGVTDIRLLSGSESLAVGERATVRNVFRVVGVAGSFLNQAEITSAFEPGGVPVAQDLSDDGSEPDANGNGDPGDPGEDDPTPILLIDPSDQPAIGLANQLTNLAEIQPGLFEAEFTLRVENLGNIAAPGIQITDNLANTFAEAVAFEVTNVSISGDIELLNPGFDGVLDLDLLSGADTLPVGGSAIITIRVSFSPGAYLGPFENQPVVTSTASGQLLATDPADDGAIVDADGDGNANEEGENDPTVFSLPPIQIGVAKALTAMNSGPVGATDLTFTFVIENLSDTRSAQFVQLTDDFAAAFPGAELTVISPPEVMGGLTEGNTDFDGITDTQLLTGLETLAAGASATLTVTVRVAGISGIFLNQAEVTAALIAGGEPIARDLSDDGDNPDPNSDGNPGDPGEDDPTPVELPGLADQPVVGIAKTLVGLEENSAGTFAGEFVLRVENLSDFAAPSVQIVEPLGTTFLAIPSFEVVSVDIAGDLTLLNPAYDGLMETGLLSGAETLPAGGQAVVTIRFNMTPADNLGPFTNQATVTSTRDGVLVARDLSDDGTNVDADGDGNPNEDGENDPTVFGVPPVQLGVAKSLVSVDPTDDGTELTFAFVIENLSTVRSARFVQLTDDLGAAFPGAAITIVSAPVASGALTLVNTGFDGVTDTRLLSGTESLPPGAAANVAFSVRVSGISGTFLNQAEVTAAEMADGDPVARDLSDDGTDPDPDGNGDPGGAGEDDPTPVQLPVVDPDTPAIGLAKALSSVTRASENSFDVALTFTLENLSTTRAANFVQLTDDLATTFPGAQLTIVEAPQVSGGLSAGNPDFDGSTDTNLLSGDETLAPATTASVAVVVRVAGVTGAFTNQAELTTANSLGGDPVARDLSDDGTTPDSNGNGRADDAGEDDPTPIMLNLAPTEATLGLAKAVGEVVNNGDGTFSLPFILRVENLGAQTLTDLQIVDDLAVSFPAPSEFTLAGVPESDTLATNSSFDGVADTALLAGSDSLAPFSTASVSFTVVLTPNGQTQFENVALASATDPEGEPVEDDSTEGSEVDPDNDGDPTNNSDPTPVEVPTEMGAGVIGIAKTTLASNVTGEGTVAATFRLLVENLGDETLTEVQITEDLAAAFPVPAVVVLTEGPSITGALSELNTNFDGVGDTSLLSGTESLAPGEIATVDLSISITLNGASGPFSNQVVAVGTNPGGDPSEDRSDDGVDPDPNDDGDPTGPGEDDPTVVDFPAALVGTVFEDLNVDGQLDQGDARLSGWTVELLDEEGSVVATTLTDADGSYAFVGQTPGEYVVRFSNPDSQTVWGARSATLVEATVSRVDFPVVPGGRFYDSSTREPVGGVEVALLDETGNPLDESCLLPGQQNQIVDASGAYRFDVIPGAHPTCPTGGTSYRIAIVSVPDNYRPRPSFLLPVEAEPLVVGTCAIDPDPEPPCVVQTQTTPPDSGDDTTYYLQWLLAEGDGSVANNHIPLDPTGDRPGSLVSVSKRAEQDTAVQGDLVGYEVLVTNLTAIATPPLELLDDVPPGFQFVPDSQTLRLPGPDNQLDTPDDVVTDLAASGVDPRILGPLVVPGDSAVAVRYLLRVSTGVARGEYINTVTPLIGGTPIGPPGSATVEVVGDPIFEKTTIIGKVFNDANKNGKQDEEEVGLPGVRLATVGGLLVETDQYGRYHIADVDVPRAERGANFILKLDTATLPRDAEVISENPRVLRITQALMSKINFAVHIESQQKIIEVRQPYKETRTVTYFADEYIEPVRFASGQSDIPESYLSTLRELLERYEDRKNLRVRFTGHTDNQPLSENAARTYVDNQGLSVARAKRVAQFAKNRLGLKEEDIEIVGKAFSEPIASNDTLDGMRLNRRVEIDIIFDESLPEETVVTDYLDAADPQLPTDTIEEHFATNVERIEPVRFGSGEAEMSTAARNELDRRLANFLDVEVLALEVVGHADASPYQGNDRLSRLRAQSVASYIAAQLSIDEANVTVSSRGANDPIATNDTVAGRDLNRRAEVALTVRRVSSRVETRFALLTPIREERWVDVPGRGRLWMVEDALLNQPQMDVIALNELVVDAQGYMVDGVVFAAHNNYDAYVDGYQLDIYTAEDTDFLDPLDTLPVKELAFPEAFEWLDDKRRFRPGQRLAYVLRARSGDVEDVTHARLLEVVPSTKANLIRVEPASIWAQNNLDRQRINLKGSRIRVHGADFEPGSVIDVAGKNVPVDDGGSFVYEFYARPGVHTLPISGRSTLPEDDGGDEYWRTTLKPEVDDNYAFIVGLANLTVGDHSLSGNFEPLSVDDHFDQSVYVDGRLAFYAKAKIKGKYLITAQLDSTEDELSNFTDNLKREDPRRLFRQLDPNRYYAVYGDDSTTVSDVDSQGAFYLRVDWDRNQVLWGNFNTGMTDTEYLQYNRSLYGAKFSHKSNATTKLGDTARSITLFGSEAQSAAAHVSFRATGGSLYYLKHTDVVQGSEKVWVEVRQRDTQQVVERQDFVEGRDYEVDALQGRIILRHPLSQVVNDRAPAIIRSSPLEGDDVYLLVDYEYVPDSFSAEDTTFGGRAKVWLGDHVAVGVTKVVDERSGTDFDLEGVDITLKVSNGTYLSAEIAQSEARQNNANFASADGGLSFNSQNSVLPDDLSEGDALAVEGRLNLQDVSDSVRGDVRAWYKERDAGFSASRLPQGTKVTEQGVDVVVQPDEGIRITAGYSELEEEGVFRSEVARVQADVKLGKVTIGGEVRHEDLERVTGTGAGGVRQQGDGLLAGLRVGYDLSDTQTLYASAQTGLNEDGEYRDNELFAIGVNTQLNEHAAISVEAADGDRGHALVGGLEYSPAEQLTLNMKGGVGPGAVSQFSGNYRLAEGHELYGSYAVDPDRTFGERNLMTLGQRRDFGNRFGIFTESQFGKDESYAGATHAFGVDYTTEQDWVLNALVQTADDEQGVSDVERNAVSIGASVKRDDYKFSAKVEYRQDESAAQESEQYLLSSSYTWVASPARRWLGQLNLSWTDDELISGKSARFVEFDIGHAYRGVENDRWNLLTKYGYFYDLVSLGQSSTRPDQRVHILSAEALYEVGARWELGGKLAVKEGQVRMFRDSGSWEDYGVGLAVLRGRYHVTKAWDGVAEYRYLKDRHGDSARHGALLGVYRHLGDHFKVGVGYNFTDFSDDIRDAEYDNHGWFVDLIGKF